MENKTIVEITGLLKDTQISLSGNYELTFDSKRVKSLNKLIKYQIETVDENIEGFLVDLLNIVSKLDLYEYSELYIKDVNCVVKEYDIKVSNKYINTYYYSDNKKELGKLYACKIKDLTNLKFLNGK